MSVGVSKKRTLTQGKKKNYFVYTGVAIKVIHKTRKKTKIYFGSMDRHESQSIIIIPKPTITSQIEQFIFILTAKKM